MSKKKKRRFGDRRDGRRVKAPGLQTVMGYLFPKRTDCEVYLHDSIDCTEVLKYIEKKNAENPAYKTTLFHCAITSMARMLRERPLMNRFIQGYVMYERDEISLLYSEIISVTSMGNYLEISALNDNVFKTRMTFSTISEQLMQDQSFLVINRGILVNMNFVANISERSCIMTNGVHFPVNAREFRKLRQTWLNFSIAQIRNNALERDIR